MPIALAKVWMKEPHPEEHASLSMIESIVAVLDLKALNVLPADVDDEVDLRVEIQRGLKCATVSTMPKSALIAAFIMSSP